MEVDRTIFKDVLVISKKIFRDRRGCFNESYNKKEFDALLEEEVTFLQDNLAVSKKDVLRGLHYQQPNPQGKLVQALAGSIWGVVVDLRLSSPYFGNWEGIEVNAESGVMYWVPPGFAHGYIAMEDNVIVSYKVSHNFYSPRNEHSIRWDDPEIGIVWPIDATPIISDKDARALPFCDAEKFT